MKLYTNHASNKLKPLWCSASNSFDLMFSYTDIVKYYSINSRKCKHTQTHTHSRSQRKQWVLSYGCLSHSNYMMCCNCRSFMHPLQTYFKEIRTHPEPQLASTAQAPEKQHGRRNDPIVLHLPSQYSLTVCRGTPALLQCHWQTSWSGTAQIISAFSFWTLACSSGGKTLHVTCYNC